MLSANRTIPAGTKEAVESTSSRFNWRNILITFGLLISLVSLAAVGLANVVAIEPCPPIEPDDGKGRRLITGTFEHSATDVIDVSVEGEEKPIGTTTTHPFRSADRNAFVPAGELKVGEQLRLENGHTTRITSIVPRAGPEKVYNIEVEGQHVFYVVKSGVLVHNSYMTSRTASPRTPVGRSGQHTTFQIRMLPDHEIHRRPLTVVI